MPVRAGFEPLVRGRSGDVPHGQGHRASTVTDDGARLDGSARGTARGRGRTAGHAGPPSRASRRSRAPIPDELHPARARGADRAGDHLALLPSGRRLGDRHAPRAHDRHDRHRERQVAVLQPAGAARAGLRPARAGALPLPDQGARAGPGAQPDASSRTPALHHAIYDGDTPQEERPAIRKRANVVLTNPDMLHVGILPHHAGVGRLPREPRARGRGRGARVPGSVRLARRQRAAPPAPARARPTAPSRGSCSRRPRSPTRCRSRRS